MVDPFALEVMANPDLLPVERPFVAAHEWAHLAGYADESEANFVGWLTVCAGRCAREVQRMVVSLLAVERRGERRRSDAAGIDARVRPAP